MTEHTCEFCSMPLPPVQPIRGFQFDHLIRWIQDPCSCPSSALAIRVRRLEERVARLLKEVV